MIGCVFVALRWKCWVGVGVDITWWWINIPHTACGYCGTLVHLRLECFVFILRIRLERNVTTIIGKEDLNIELTLFISTFFLFFY